MRDPIPFGRYHLLERLAIGGMAEIWLAEARGEPGRRYAVKRLLPTLADDPGFVTMFLDEARIGTLLDHPGIVPVRDLGREGSGYFMAMDYRPGPDLRALLTRLRHAGARLPPALSTWVVAEAARALDHAHRARGPDGAPLEVVHRDLSPANLLLGWDGRVSVLDFGIATAAFRAHREGAVLRGKLGYLSPEQVAGLPVDRRGDVFSLGAVLHELLTGHRLFGGPSDLAVLQRVRAAQVRPPSERNPAVPADLDALVLRALAREPAERFAWAADLAAALGPFTGEAPAAALAAELAARLPAELAEERERARRPAAAHPA
ncbi:MAG: serine/threonine protein kinase [Anaeromyxobacter sp.]|nr:serine/threonine protein kinase [Anaeromyxobacter sp.]MBL0277358.1 serine/threonine protein kinase [Anaeromyxobacter sp.]